MDGNQQFEIGDNIEQVAKVGLFYKFILPYLVPILLGTIFLLAAVLLVPFLFTFFPSIDLSQIGAGVFTILVLILILAIGK